MCRYKMVIEMEYGTMNINLGDIHKEAMIKYNKVKDVEKICTNLRKTNLYSDVKLELLDASSGKATISLMVDDSIYKEIIDAIDNGVSKETLKDIQAKKKQLKPFIKGLFETMYKW